MIHQRMFDMLPDLAPEDLVHAPAEGKPMDVICEIKEFMASPNLLQIITVIPEGGAQEMRPCAGSSELITTVKPRSSMKH